MEMEGLVYSDFISTLMESSVGVPIPTMEMRGFKNLSDSFRADSEELFKNWLTTGENQGYDSTSLVHNRPQQLSRMLADQVSLPSYQGSSVVGELCGTHDTKAWFNSSQPMTRSRSSELRRKYVTMQNSQTLIGIEAMHTGSTLLINQLKHDFDIPNQSTDFISTSNSLSTNNDPHTDNVSSVVSILKDTLERKKHVKNIENYYSNSNQVHGLHLDDPVLIQGLQGAMDADMEGFVVPANLVQMNVGSREGSQSESSAAAPVFSTGLDVSNRQNNSGQSQSVCGSHKKLVANGKCRENRSVTKGTG
ncbi:protein CYCLOPS isoform X2 [Tanacetum coccineum]